MPTTFSESPQSVVNIDNRNFRKTSIQPEVEHFSNLRFCNTKHDFALTIRTRLADRHCLSGRKSRRPQACAGSIRRHEVFSPISDPVKSKNPPPIRGSLISAEVHCPVGLFLCACTRNRQLWPFILPAIVLQFSGPPQSLTATWRSVDPALVLHVGTASLPLGLNAQGAPLVPQVWHLWLRPARRRCA